MQEKGTRDEEKCKVPVLITYGETVPKRMAATPVLGEGKNLPGPM
jgi:hypothetical protein